MDVRYTFRDLIVYLLTGLVCCMLTIIAHPALLLFFYRLLTFLKEKEIVIVVVLLAGVPSLYMIGHIVQIVDLIFSFNAPKPLKKYCQPPFKNKKKYFFFRWLYYFLASSTVDFNVERRGLVPEEFSK